MPELTALPITMRVDRGGRPVFRGEVLTAALRREPRELVDWLFRGQDFPAGVVLLTGTGIVPYQDFTLQAADVVVIEIAGLGRLQNPVEVVPCTPEAAA